MPKPNKQSLEDLIHLLKQTGELNIKAHITPKSQTNQLMKLEIDQSGQINIRIKIRGVPENGEVNRNLIVFLAKELHLAPGQCQITGGFKSRHKTIQIQNNAV